MCKNGLKDISEKRLPPNKVIFDEMFLKKKYKIFIIKREKKEERNKEPPDWDSLSLSI